MHQSAFRSRLMTVSLLLIMIGPVFYGIPAGAQTRSRPNNPDTSQARETNVVRIESPGIQIGYNQRRGATKVEFRRPTDPEYGDVAKNVRNRGSVKIETKGGFTEIDVCSNCEKFDLAAPASSIAPGLNTYVLWTITPTGYAQNVAEILYDDFFGGAGSDARYVDVSTTQPVFAMIVTAEPHFAVSRPSRHIVLVSRPQKVDEGNSGLRVADFVAYNPSNVPEDIDPKTLDRFQPVVNALDQAASERQGQMRNNLLQARAALAMAQTSVDNLRVVREIAQERSIREAEMLLKDTNHKPIYQQMQEALENRLRVPLYEETQAKLAIDDALRAYERALEQGNRLNAKTSARELFLPPARDARLAVQSAAAAKEFSDIAAARIEITRLRIQVDSLVRLNDELADELRRANGRIADLEGQLTRATNRIRDLERQVADLESQLADARRRIAALERDNAALRGELDRFCQELRKLVENLGEIIQDGNTITIRLKSDILFPEAVYLLTVDRDLNKDVRPRLAQLALLLQILYKDARFKFVGHTDTLDETDYNQWLSEQRALEVMRFFYTQRVQVMDGNDPLRDEYTRKLQAAEQLLDNRQFPEWLPQRRRGGLGADKRKQDERLSVFSQVSDVVEGRGETSPAVSTADNTSEPRNRRVEIQITLPGQSSLPYCNNR